MAGFDVIPAVTSAVESAKNIFQADGPAKGLADLGTSIKDKLSGAVDSITSIFSGKNITPLPYPLPLQNILHNYATYNYVFSIGVLKPEEYNFPDTTYKAGKIPQLILKSGNSNPDNRVKTAYGKFDFFIDNVVIDGFIGNDRSTGNTNANNISFQVTEPYSMGLFMIAMQTAAGDAGYKNFRQAPFIMIIEFRGNTQTGIAQKVPNTTKYLPFKLSAISMKVTGKGSVYSCEAVPYNEKAFSKQVSNLKTDAKIVGKTVQEVLQTGPESLQVVMNNHYKELKDKGVVTEPDQILILFPDEVASESGGASGGDSDKENDAPATQSDSGGADGDLYKKLGVSISAKNKTLVQDEKKCNLIGQAKMGYSKERKPSTPTAKSDKVYNNTTNVDVRGKMSIDPELSEFKFTQDTNIINAINQVILASEFATEAMDPKNLSPQGYRGWWKIHTQTFIIATDANLKSTGTEPKLYVYRVVPYKAHASKGAPPNAAIPGFAKLKKEAVKQYDYIYTGKNVDILNFTIDIENTFQSMMLADLGNKTADVKTQEKDSASTKEKADIAPVKGVTPSTAGKEIPTETSYSAVKTKSDNKGGGPSETNSSRVAKLFHDALINAKDLVNLDIDIVGDPYYLTSSGMGNYVAGETDHVNINADGDINYYTGDVDIVVNFRTPIDINQTTGLYDFGKSVEVQQFSGLYKVTNITSTFNRGKFSQKLTGFRRQGQSDYRNATTASVPTATPSTKSAPTEYAEIQGPPPGVQVFDDGSSIQTMDDGSTLVTDKDGNISSTPSPD
jgi:hypothetical protein